MDTINTVISILFLLLYIPKGYILYRMVNLRYLYTLHTCRQLYLVRKRPWLKTKDLTTFWLFRLRKDYYIVLLPNILEYYAAIFGSAVIFAYLHNTHTLFLGKGIVKILHFGRNKNHMDSWGRWESPSWDQVVKVTEFTASYPWSYPKIFDSNA